MKIHRPTGVMATAAAVALILATASARPARADFQLINNGGFDSGFAGWNRADSVGSEGTFLLQSGALSPLTGTPVPAPPSGVAAMTDAEGPGSHVLYQDFVVPAGITGGTLRFSLFVGNRGPSFFTPNPASLDFATPALNQQARVDILRAGSDPFGVSAADVLLNAFQTNPGTTFGPGYTTITVDVGAILAARGGQTLRLRFAEVDNVNPFQLGVANVSLTAVPEPSSLALCGVAGLLCLAHLRRRGRGGSQG